MDRQAWVTQQKVVFADRRVRKVHCLGEKKTERGSERFGSATAWRA
jgi:hypothetical protein